MLDSSFVSVFSTGLTLGGLLICLAVALVLGAVMALAYQYKTTCSRSFVLTLASLPAIVTVVIIMVGGNLGAGVAVAGTFSLVRFRSMPGTAREICAIFLSMTVGLACGAGYPVVGAILAVLVCLFNLLLLTVNFGGSKCAERQKQLRITVPEDLNYTNAFDDIFAEHTLSCTLTSIKTTNLGSLSKLTYDIVLKKEGTEKVLIDALRCRNGNLEIAISTLPTDIKDL